MTTEPTADAGAAPEPLGDDTAGPKLLSSALKISGLEGCSPGDEYTATLRFRVTSQPSDTGEVDVEPLSVDDVQESQPGAEGALEDSGELPSIEPGPAPAPPSESEMLGYSRPKKPKVPFGGAQSLRG